jgi:serpin B
MDKKQLLIILAVVVVVAVGYFGYNYTQDYLLARGYAQSDTLAAEVDPELVKANTGFALDLFDELCADSPDSNVFISPLSISTALTMAYSGSDGTTEEAMRNTLGYRDLTTEEIEEGYENLLMSLAGVDNKVQLSIANSVWVQEDFDEVVYEEYKETLETHYMSEYYARPFNQATVNELNDWVNEKTEGKIDKILDQIDPQNVMFLLNAIYFKADWTNQFEESKTQKRDFALTDGTIVQVDTMAQKEDFKYSNGNDYAACRLPYGREQVAMYVFLPDREVALDDFMETLDPDSLNEIIDGMHEVSDLKLRLPKFKFEYGKKRLNDALSNMGMEVAFNPYEANLSKIAKIQANNLYIDFVDHKALIEVDEEGTVAAAVTNVGITIESAPISETEFYVDRPFFFIIRDDRTGTILFMGRITNPLEESGF